ncbi:MAG: hypothetical protein Unbinned2902contig1001_36 [Prokaryotic dsDNA virus sp.]|nr:MAG: hypothetical protein Unbinned2902contig1001_36 [Prokaryotic dsDNA virus sp.]
MEVKRKMIPSNPSLHNKVMEHLGKIRQQTGVKITITSFYESAVIEKLQRDKFKRSI